MDEENHHELKHRYRAYFGVYNRYSVPGFILLFFGISIFGLGCFDIGWTVSRYDASTCSQSMASPGINACSGNHIFSLVGSSLWGGALLIINGVMALWMPHRYISHSCMFQFYSAVTFINLMAATPAIVVLNVLEITMNNNVFYTYTTDSGFVVADMAKFAVIFTIAVLGAVDFIVLAGVLMVACLCPAPKKYRQNYKRPFSGWHMPHPRMPNFPHPHMPHFAPRHQPHFNAQGRPMMYNPSMPSMYGAGYGAGYAPYMQAGAGGAPQVGGPMALPAIPPVYYDPYRFYNAMAAGYGNGGYDRGDDRRRSDGRRRRHRDDYSDRSSEYSY